MYNIDDCLFRTSISVSIEGDADIGKFQTQMENSYTTFIQMLDVQLISSSPRLWSFSAHNEMCNQSPECIDALVWIIKFFLKALPRYKDKYSETYLTSVNFERLVLQGEPFWFFADQFSDIEMREAFATALNDRLIPISYKGIVVKDYGLCFCFEFEDSTTIHQYYWRPRWVLTLVNFLINSQKISQRSFHKAAVVIRHLRKRLFKKPKQQV